MVEGAPAAPSGGERVSPGEVEPSASIELSTSPIAVLEETVSESQLRTGKPSTVASSDHGEQENRGQERV